MALFGYFNGLIFGLNIGGLSNYTPDDETKKQKYITPSFSHQVRWDDGCNERFPYQYYAVRGSDGM